MWGINYMNINTIAIIAGGFFLLLCSAYDLRYKQIPTKWIIAGGIFAILWIVIILFKGEWGYLFGSMEGIFLLILGKVTEEKIGYGDGLVVTIVGVLGTFYMSFVILMTALFLIAFYGGILVCFKKASHRVTIPFIPFYFAAYLWAHFTLF